MTPEEIALYGPPLSAHWSCTTTATHKKCSNCERWKEHSKFTKCKQAKLSGRRPRCKKCVKETYGRNHTLQKYGMSQEAFLSMQEAQDFRCSICGTEDTGASRTEHLSIDHNHETGKVRGLLCMQCNTGLGSFKDKPELLRKATKYLEKHQ